jgi:hypothetical protein
MPAAGRLGNGFERPDLAQNRSLVGQFLCLFHILSPLATGPQASKLNNFGLTHSQHRQNVTRYLNRQRCSPPAGMPQHHLPCGNMTRWQVSRAEQFLHHLKTGK